MFLDVRPFDYVFLFGRPIILGQPSNTYVEEFYFQVKGPKLILHSIKKSAVAVVE